MEIKSFYPQDLSGNVLASAEVTVYLAGTLTPATGLQDVNGTPRTNPFIADADGLVQFGVQDGVYDIKAVAPGRSSTLKAVRFFGGTVNLTVLAAATTPANDADLVMVQQGGVSKKMPFGTVRTEFATAAVAAQAAAELARDAALVGAGVYVDEPTGRAAVADGVAFKVQGSGDVAAYEYRRVNAGSSTLIATYPSASSVISPKWAGKNSGWFDPFFRYSTPGTDFMPDTGSSLKRWYEQAAGNAAAAYSKVANTVFDGYMLRRTLDGTNLSGPRIFFGDVGAASGDTVTACMLVKGSGTLSLFARQNDNAGAFTSAQIVGKRASDDVSASGIAAPASATLFYFSFTVDASGYALSMFPECGAASQMDIVALWAFKGALSTGPQWPAFADEHYRRHESRLAAIETDVSPVITSYFDVSTAVSASATAVNLTGSGFSSFARDLTFSGCGGRFTPAAVSFNAIRVVAASRTQGTAGKWAYLKAVVRTGANSHQAGSTVIAVGAARVPTSKDDLSNVTIVLKDPITGAVKTLTNADFSGGEYFIGVYAETITGADAALGDILGSLSNFISGGAHYLTTGDPLTGAWPLNVGNPSIGFEHLLLTSPVESLAQTPNANLAAATIGTPELIVPPQLYTVVGREANAYFDSMYLDDAENYYQDVVTGIVGGKHQDERWTVVPSTAGASNAITFKSIEKRSGLALVTKSANVRMAAAAAGTGLTKKLLFIGDSWINGGSIQSAVVDIAGTDVMGVALHGTRGSGTNKHEGRGGWRVDDYVQQQATASRTYYKFTASGVTTPPSTDAVYTHNGYNFTVDRMVLSAGAGPITCLGTGAPLASGTLTKASGTGDATIAFSASAVESPNPFWIGGAINFAQYLLDYSIPVLDWVFINLGVNDMFGETSDAAAVSRAQSQLTLLDTLIASIKASDAGTKVGIMIPGASSFHQDGFGDDYGSGQTKWRYKRNLVIWAREVIAKYSASEANRIYIVPGNTAIDSVNNASYAAAEPVNSRSSVNLARQSDSVHPAVAGYQQVGDLVWAFLKYHA